MADSITKQTDHNGQSVIFFIDSVAEDSNSTML